jgi:hypothetical protein
MRHLGCDGWDPHHRPEPEPVGPYDVALCTYVLNVLPEPQRAPVLARLAELAPVAYVTVRADVEAASATQHDVWLDLPLLYACRGFRVYRVG